MGSSWIRDQTHVAFVSSVQFSSVTLSCPTLCDLMDCNTPGFPVHHQLPEFTQTHAHWVGDASSSSVVPFSSHLQSFPASGTFPMSQFFASGGQSIGVSALASVLPMNIQDWFPLGWTGWICFHLCSLCRKMDSLPLKHQGSPGFFSSSEVIFIV